MYVWIVLKNGEINQVFDNETAAIHHYNSMIKKWSVMKIVKKEVKSF